LRRAEIDAFGRQASKLRRDDAELAEKEKAALKALESVLWASLLEYRSILEDRVKGLLDESLALMASFESQGLELFQQHGLCDLLPREKETGLGRFLACQGIPDLLVSFVDPIGAHQSYLERKEVGQRLGAA